MRTLFIATVLAMSATTANAQSALVLFGHAGRTWPTTALADSGDDLSFSFALGAGAALQVNGHVALRASFTRTTPTYSGSTVSLAPATITRTYIGGDLQVGWPGDTPTVPYLLLGGGVVRSDPKDAAQEATSNIAARIGVGVNRLMGYGVFFVEALGMVHQFSGLGFDRLQIDLTVQAGWAVAVPF